MVVKFFDNSFSVRDDLLRKRFLREANLLAKIQHPGIPYVVTKGDVPSGRGTVPYTVLQFISGVTFEALLKEKGKLPHEIVATYIAQILKSLSHVHSVDVIHRDIKPSNLMISNSNHTFLIDFSIGYSSATEPGLTRVTEVGTHMGTVDYMSPEQKRDMSSVDKRSDLYSLGVVMLELLTGKVDFTGMAAALSLSLIHI